MSDPVHRFRTLCIVCNIPKDVEHTIVNTPINDHYTLVSPKIDKRYCSSLYEYISLEAELAGVSEEEYIMTNVELSDIEGQVSRALLRGLDINVSTMLKSDVQGLAYALRKMKESHAFSKHRDMCLLELNYKLKLY